MTPHDYLTRCQALAARGLDQTLVDDLKTAGDVVLLEELEDAPASMLARLTVEHHRRRHRTWDALAHLAVAVGLTAAPLLWEGDQA